MTNILAETCTLVVFKASQWTGRKLDKGATAQVLEANNASTGAASVHKHLVGKDALGSINGIVSEARTFHYSETLSWLDDGPRILPAKRFENYMDAMDAFERRFRDAVNAFCADYETYVERAQHMLGGMFKRADYPSALRIASHFDWNVSPLPIPDQSDFRADLPATAMARAKADVERRANDAMALAVRDVFERVHDKVSAVVEKLTTYKPATGDHKAQGIFRDSLIDNVRALVSVLPDLNVTGDARIAALANAMEALCKYDAVSLRESDDLRAKTAQTANAILQDVADMMA